MLSAIGRLAEFFKLCSGPCCWVTPSLVSHRSWDGVSDLAGAIGEKDLGNRDIRTVQCDTGRDIRYDSTSAIHPLPQSWFHHSWLRFFEVGLDNIWQWQATNINNWLGGYWPIYMEPETAGFQIRRCWAASQGTGLGWSRPLITSHPCLGEP